MKDRIDSFDILKTISIILVIFCHFTILKSDSILANISMLLTWGAVPCFMMVSGVLVGRRAKSDISWCFKKIIISYVGIGVWNTIYLFTQMAMFKLHFGLKDIICFIFFFKELEGIKVEILWYMKAYIMVILFTPLISFLYNQGKMGVKLLWYIMCVLFIQSMVLPELSFWISQQFASLAIFLPFNAWADMIFFFIFGIFCYEYKNKFLKYMNRGWFFLVFVSGLVYQLITRYKLNGSFTWDNLYLDNGYNRIGTILLAFSLFSLICFYKQPKWLVKISRMVGKNTLGIYYIHYLLLIIISTYIYPYLEKYRGVGLNIVKTIMVLIVANVITACGKKFLMLVGLFFQDLKAGIDANI